MPLTQLGFGWRFVPSGQSASETGKQSLQGPMTVKVQLFVSAMGQLIYILAEK